MGIGKTQPNGKKIVELRQQKGLKQNDLAGQARISERLLRDIERMNKPVPATTISDIASAPEVDSDDITLSRGASEDLQPLKLKAVRSALELSRMAEAAIRCRWKLHVDPTSATVKEIQQLLKIIHHLVEKFSEAPDEFYNEDPTIDFGNIARLARLQDLLDTLRAGGVGVLAALSYYNKVNKVPRPSGIPAGKICIVEIRFVPSHVDEEVITRRRPSSPGAG